MRARTWAVWLRMHLMTPPAGECDCTLFVEYLQDMIDGFRALSQDEEKVGSSLFQVGRLNWIFPSLRYIISMRFLVVLKPLALLFAD